MLQLFKNKTSLLVFALLMWSSTILADPPVLPGEGDPGSEPTVPINDWIPYVLLITIAIAFYFVYKKKAVKA